MCKKDNEPAVQKWLYQVSDPVEQASYKLRYQLYHLNLILFYNGPSKREQIQPNHFFLRFDQIHLLVQNRYSRIIRKPALKSNIQTLIISNRVVSIRI